MRRILIALTCVLTIGVGNVIGQDQELSAEEKKMIEEQTKIASYQVNHAFRVYQTARSLNDLSAAKNALLDILVEVPQNDSLLFELGTVYFQMQMYQSAAVCAREVLKLRPKDVAAVEMAAVSYENLGANQAALESYEKLFLLTDDFNALYKTTLFQYELERFKEAETNVGILLTRSEADEVKFPLMTTENTQKEYPMKALLYNIQGLVKKELGDNAAAKESFENALKIAPDFAAAKEYLEELGN